jgi:hypothetical protein
LDQAGIDGKARAANKALVDAALQDSLEQPTGTNRREVTRSKI